MMKKHRSTHLVDDLEKPCNLSISKSLNIILAFAFITKLGVHFGIVKKDLCIWWSYTNPEERRGRAKGEKVFDPLVHSPTWLQCLRVSRVLAGARSFFWVSHTNAVAHDFGHLPFLSQACWQRDGSEVDLTWGADVIGIGLTWQCQKSSDNFKKA